MGEFKSLRITGLAAKFYHRVSGISIEKK